MQLFILLVLGIFLTISPLVLHEMGHWAMLARYRVPVNQYWLGLGPAIFKWGKLRVGMLPIGGAVVPDEAGYRALKPAQRFAVALAGPVASALYGAALLLGWYCYQQEAYADVLHLIALGNFMLAGLNLLPVPPLDGFQALCSWLEMRKKPLTTQTLGWACRAGNGLVYGVGFMVLGLALLR